MTQNKFTKDELLTFFSAENKKFVAPDDIRTKAIYRYNTSRFPSKNDEDWKHTSIEPLLMHKYSTNVSGRISNENIEKLAISDLPHYKIIFVNGKFCADLSDSCFAKGIEIKPITDARESNNSVFNSFFEKTNISETNIFTTLNSVQATEGMFLEVADNTQIDKALHVIHVISSDSGKPFTQFRNLIVVGKNSRIELFQTYHSFTDEASWTNVVTEAFISKNAQLSQMILQGEGNHGMQTNHQSVWQERDSRYDCNTVTFCGKLVRNELKIEFLDENCSANLSGISLADKKQHIDNYTNINHAKPHCESNQIYRAIADDFSSVVFLGRVNVAKNAQKSLANQANNNILMSETAKIYSKPQLEIYADDVKCSHGSTTGRLNDEALFYLSARGISKDGARKMLLKAFIGEVLKQVKNQKYSQHIENLVSKRIDATKEKGECHK